MAPEFDLESIMRPGLDCLNRETAALNRETAATQKETNRLREKAAELSAKIDVLSGAYALRHQLETELRDQAIKHARAVLKWDGLNEQSKVARKFLRDNDAIVGGPFDPTEDERIEHEMRKTWLGQVRLAGARERLAGAGDAGRD